MDKDFYKKRNEKIYVLRTKDPFVWTYSKIGRIYRITPQRVEQIYKKMVKKNGSETDPELHDSLKSEQE